MTSTIAPALSASDDPALAGTIVVRESCGQWPSHAVSEDWQEAWDLDYSGDWPIQTDGRPGAPDWMRCRLGASVEIVDLPLDDSAIHVLPGDRSRGRDDAIAETAIAYGVSTEYARRWLGW